MKTVEEAVTVKLIPKLFLLNMFVNTRLNSVNSNCIIFVFEVSAQSVF